MAVVCRGPPRGTSGAAPGRGAALPWKGIDTHGLDLSPGPSVGPNFQAKAVGLGASRACCQFDGLAASLKRRRYEDFLPPRATWRAAVGIIQKAIWLTANALSLSRSSTTASPRASNRTTPTTGERGRIPLTTLPF